MASSVSKDLCFVVFFSRKHASSAKPVTVKEVLLEIKLNDPMLYASEI